MTIFGNEAFTDEESARIQLLLERRLAGEEMSQRSGQGKGQHTEALVAFCQANDSQACCTRSLSIPSLCVCSSVRAAKL